jgi:Lon protease-like protein
MKEGLLPLFPLRVALFPGMYLPLRIFEDRYRLLIQRCLDEEREFGVVLIRSGAEAGGPAQPYAVGATARILRLTPQENGRFYIVIQGEERFRIKGLNQDLPYLQAEAEPLLDTDSDDPGLSALSAEVGIAFKRYIALLISFADRWIGDFDLPSDPAAMSFFVAGRLNLSSQGKQHLLETVSARQRLTEEMEMMRRESAQLEMIAAAKTPATGPPPS